VVDDPEAFRAQLDSGAEKVSLADLGWWDLFQDVHLKALIRSGLIENKDLRLAVSRVREARAQFGATQADQFPQIDGNTSLQRNQTSGAVARQFGIQGGGNREGPTTNQFKATVDFSFEIGLWGKVRRSTEAAQAELLGQEWAQRTVVLTLVSDMAQAYFDLQELDVELEIANLTLKTRQESLDIIRLRKLMGQGSTLDIRRADQEVARAQAVIPNLERQIGQKENQLSILIERNPNSYGHLPGVWNFIRDRDYSHHRSLGASHHRGFFGESPRGRNKRISYLVKRISGRNKRISSIAFFFCEIRDTNDEIRATSDRSSRGRSFFSPKKGQECEKSFTVEHRITKRIFV